VLPTLAAAAILGAGGVGASAALSGGGGDHPSGVRPSLPIATSVPSPTPARGVTPSATPSVSSSRPAATVPDFALTVTGRVSWVQVIGPRGRVLIAAIVRHGRTLTYKQRPLIVTLGDAGAVRLVLHHHAHAPAGKRGAVLRFTYR
jgi:hypothetical protein